MPAPQERRKSLADILRHANILGGEQNQSQRDLKQAIIESVEKDTPSFKLSSLLALPTVVSLCIGFILTLYSSVHSLSRDTLFWEESKHADYRFIGLVFLLAGFILLFFTYYAFTKTRRRALFSKGMIAQNYTNNATPDVTTDTNR